MGNIELFHSLARYVDKVLNLRTAKALAVTLPPALLLEADDLLR